MISGLISTKFSTLLHNAMRAIIIIALVLVSTVHACTNYLISAGASADNSTMISYAADSHTLYGFLLHLPAADHPEGTMHKIFEWDTGKYLGEIPEVNHTYNVIGNINQFGLSIGETTFEGLEELQSQPDALIDYGSLIYMSLQRAKTAREAIHVMGDLVEKYGYYSTGESFSVADPNEAWILELIGKGKGEKGAVWVAQRVPDGSICAHANQARIRTFPLNDSDNCIYAPDVVSFAQDKGYYPKTAPADKFSFSDIYCPITFENARFCEVRVWSFFRHLSSGMDQYLDYVQGKNLDNRMPLFIKPSAKVTVNQTMNLMRDHLEDTWFDFRQDIGAQAFEMPYRWRPLTWKNNGKTYLNERAVGTQQTGFSFVSQLRSNMPDFLKGLLWFGVDDTASSVYAPMYGCMTDVPMAYAKETGAMMEFSFDSAFWVFNMVSNFAYQRYNLIHPEIAKKIGEHESYYLAQVPNLDAAAAELYKTDPAAAIKMATDFSVKLGSELALDWLEFWKYLFVKYMDGNVKTADPGSLPPIKVDWPGYPEATLKRIVDETGDHYLVPGDELNRNL